MQLFGTLKLLMALLGSSWPLLGPIWPQNGPQNGPQSGQMTPKKVNFKPILGPKMDPKMVQDGEGGAQAEPAGALLKALVFKMVPRWVKMAPRSPR